MTRILIKKKAAEAAIMLRFSRCARIQSNWSLAPRKAGNSGGLRSPEVSADPARGHASTAKTALPE